MAFSAQGAVDSLLGRLSSVLVDEAQMLGSVRGEIRFINDEMETMNGLLMHLGEAQDHNHLVRAWMKQVQDLAYDSQNCVEKYMRCLGAGRHDKDLLSRMRRVPWLLLTVQTRHRIATRIRELKVRVSEVSERRLRYDIRVPDAPPKQQPTILAPRYDGKELQDDDRRRRALFGVDAECDRADVAEVMKWLTEESGDEEQDARVRVICVAGWDGSGKDPVARKVYEHSSVASLFDCKASITLGGDADLTKVLGNILSQLLPNNEQRRVPGMEIQQLKEELKGHLSGKRFLLVLDDVHDESAWSDIKSAVPASGGSAMILATRASKVAEICSPYKIFNYFTKKHTNIFLNTADTLLANNPNKDDLLPVIQCIVSHRTASFFAMKLFLHVLYFNPYRTKEELENLADDLNRCKGKAAEQMLMFCYNELPIYCKSSLLYLTIFPQGYRIRRTSLVRRWVVEGLISTRSKLSALDEAELCFYMLANRGFIHAVDWSAAGKVKACIVHPPVFHFITWMARYENFMGMNTVLDKAVQNGMDGIESLLQSLSASSSRLRLLKVLDLQGCTGLKKHHLKNICNNILLLKYLSIRNTDVTCLPKKINKLQHLETLDIRQTEIQTFPKRGVFPMLKHLLAGHTKYRWRADGNRPNGLYSTVRIPPGIRSMKQLQILSRVQVSQVAQELEDVGWLPQLKKLGVVLHGSEVNIKHLLRVIDRLNKCLCSLFIRIEPPSTIMGSLHVNTAEIVFSPPKFLQNLSISGISGGLPSWIGELHHLIKITLYETSLMEHDLHILSKLDHLGCLMLMERSCLTKVLVFRKEEFQNLKLLVVEGFNIRSIKFETGATPKLEKIVWSFVFMECLSGIDHLPRLTMIELNGEGVTYLVKQAINEHPNHPIFKHNC